MEEVTYLRSQSKPDPDLPNPSPLH